MAKNITGLWGYKIADKEAREKLEEHDSQFEKFTNERLDLEINTDTNNLHLINKKGEQLGNGVELHTFTDEQVQSVIDKAIEDGKITGSSINTTAKTLLQTILQNAVYTTDQSANITALMSALGSTESGGSSGGDTPTAKTYTITNNLTNCTNSNVSTSIDENSNYIATITANSGYTLANATVTVTMGGTNITSTAYNDSKISIAKVTGDIIITIKAVKIVSDVKEITPDYLNLASSNRVTITDVDAMATDMPDVLSLIAKNVNSRYWNSGINCTLGVRDTSYTQQKTEIAYTNKTITVDDIMYAIITITKEDYNTAYQKHLNKIESGLINYVSTILFGNSESRFDSTLTIKAVNGNVDENVIRNLTW